jgi:hypoxanthine phosphoribosyltransferase
MQSGKGQLESSPDANSVCTTQVHKLCQSSAERILKEFKPQLMVAIGGGGYVPARILRYTILIHTYMT